METESDTHQAGKKRFPKAGSRLDLPAVPAISPDRLLNPHQTVGNGPRISYRPKPNEKPMKCICGQIWSLKPGYPVSLG